MQRLPRVVGAQVYPDRPTGYSARYEPKVGSGSHKMSHQYKANDLHFRRTKRFMMHTKSGAIALVGILYLLTHTANGLAQSEARADIKNSEGKIVGTAFFRETKDGMLITVNAKALPHG